MLRCKFDKEHYYIYLISVFYFCTCTYDFPSCFKCARTFSRIYFAFRITQLIPNDIAGEHCDYSTLISISQPASQWHLNNYVSAIATGLTEKTVVRPCVSQCVCDNNH